MESDWPISTLMMKITSRLMACPLCLDCVPARLREADGRINRGETIRRVYDCWHGVAGRNVAALSCRRRWPAADPPKLHSPPAATARVNNAPDQRLRRLR